LPLRYAGGVGLLLVQMAHNIGARVIATVSTEEKAKLARAAGADEVILYTQADFEVETKRLTGGKGVDVVMEHIGGEVFTRSLQCLKRNGIIVTVGAWDRPQAWVRQLVEGGRLVVPLRLRSLTRSIAFERHGDRLESRSAEVCGFVPMRGIGAHTEGGLSLRGGEISLRFDDGLPGDAAALEGAFGTARVEVWTGVLIERTVPFDTLQLWLATRLDGYCSLAVDPGLDTGVVSPISGRANDAVIDGDCLGYLAARRVDGSMAEFGVHAFGVSAAAVAQAMAEQVRVWDREHRHGPGPRIVVWPAHTPDDLLPEGRVIDKRHSRVTISWPLASLPDAGLAIPQRSTEQKG